MSKFKVGQVWRTRGDNENPPELVTISRVVDHEHYPVDTDDGLCYTLDGKYTVGIPKHYRDLVELVTDAPSEITTESAAEYLVSKGYTVKPRPVKERGVIWVNIYPDNTPQPRRTKQEVDQIAGDDRLACVRVEWVEGQFDTEPEKGGA